ncbi:MAG: acyl-CoA dehydrogenase C-terminal domain-containing protein [Vicinamibacterales bacterium]
MLAGTVCGGWQMAVPAKAALRRLAAGEGNGDFLRATLLTARFYAEQILPRAQMHRDAGLAGSRTMMALDEAHVGL